MTSIPSYSNGHNAEGKSFPQNLSRTSNSTTKIFAALFHLATFMSNAYMLYVFPKVNGLKLRGEDTFAGQWKFLTHINHQITTWYCFLAFVCCVGEIFGLLRKRPEQPPQLRSIVDRIFCLCCGMNSAVGIFYWGLVLYSSDTMYNQSDRELFGTPLHRQLGMYQHGVLAILMWTEMLLIPHAVYSDFLWGEYGIGAVVCLSSWFWSYIVLYVTGQWAYPFMNKLAPAYIILFVAVNVTVTLLAFTAARGIVPWRWQIPSKKASSKKKSLAAESNGHHPKKTS